MVVGPVCVGSYYDARLDRDRFEKGPPPLNIRHLRRKVCESRAFMDRPATLWLHASHRIDDRNKLFGMWADVWPEHSREIWAMAEVTF